MSYKAAILVGGAQKGTRFRPLSLQLPKPLFPIAGVPLVEHHIDTLSQLTGLTEVVLIGFYPEEEFTEFCDRCQKQYRIPIRYLKESTPHGSGTAGGLAAFSSDLLRGSPDAIFVLNADVCGDLPVEAMTQQLQAVPEARCVVLTTEATREQSINFGCVVIGQGGRVLHYVDKPTTFISVNISCGVYIMRPDVIKSLPVSQSLWFETDLFPHMASSGTLYAYNTKNWWSQTKTAAAVLYANRSYLRLYKKRYAARLCIDRAQIIGDVFIDPSAEVDVTAKIGPNVSIGPNAKVGKGVRIKESIILGDARIEQHACVMHSVVGWRSVIGAWARVEGIPISPNPNIPFAKLENRPLFNEEGRLTPSVTILGSDVIVAPETIILNCVVLPYKELEISHTNQIIL